MFRKTVLLMIAPQHPQLFGWFGGWTRLILFARPSDWGVRHSEKPPIGGWSGCSRCFDTGAVTRPFPFTCPRQFLNHRPDNPRLFEAFHNSCKFLFRHRIFAFVDPDLWRESFKSETVKGRQQRVLGAFCVSTVLRLMASRPEISRSTCGSPAQFLSSFDCSTWLGTFCDCLIGVLPTRKNI